MENFHPLHVKCAKKKKQKAFTGRFYPHGVEKCLLREEKKSSHPSMSVGKIAAKRKPKKTHTKKRMEKAWKKRKG